MAATEANKRVSFLGLLFVLGFSKKIIFKKKLWRFGVGFKHWMSSKAVPLKSGLGWPWAFGVGPGHYLSSL